MPRRLSAILAVDVVDFSTMMSRDEDGTLEMLLAFRKAALDPLTRQHGGRVVKVVGDAALVEFPSVVGAVECALALQAATSGFRDGALKLRIGVHLGDVIVEGGDIYGDGVNIAARLEGVAAAGGISISGLVHQSLGPRVSPQFRDRGVVPLKGISQPVQVFDWSPDAVVEQITEGHTTRKTDRPTIAVMAFDNMSGDAEQEYFSDGIAEDVITALSHFREFFVMARNTTFSFKGHNIRVDEVCKELGVRYLLEGSVRRAGNRVRVTAQLIDGDTGAHLWAEKFDRELSDIFLVQDEITRAIVAAVAPETMNAEVQRARHQTPENLSAWDKVLRGRHLMSQLNRDAALKSKELLSLAVKEAPEMATGLTALALSELYTLLHLWDDDTLSSIRRMHQTAERKVRQDPRDADARQVFGTALMFDRDFDAAEEQLLRARTLNPNLASAYGALATLHGVSGEYEKSKDAIALALELSPRDPLKFFWLGGFGAGVYLAGRYEETLDLSRRILRDHPGYASAMRQEAASLGMLGRSEESTASVSRILDRMPGLTVEKVRHIVPIRHPDDHEHWLEGLRRAGLPER